jgi:hypothetical protein
MHELTLAEVNEVSGATTPAGNLTAIGADFQQFLKMLPGIYDTAIQSTTDMMCRFTSKCS